MSEGGRTAVKADEVGSSGVQELDVRVRDLEWLFGRKTLKVEVLKEVRATERVPVKTVEALSVALSNLLGRIQGQKAARSISAPGSSAEPASSVSCARHTSCGSGMSTDGQHGHVRVASLPWRPTSAGYLDRWRSTC
jgi:hypothetical protein